MMNKFNQPVKSLKRPFGPYRKKAARVKRIKEICSVYKKTRNLRKTGAILGISQECVRQWLRKGRDTGIIRLPPRGTLRLAGLFDKTDKIGLIREIEAAGHVNQLLSKYAVSTKELHGLLKCFGLNYGEIKKSARVTRCLRDYFQTVRALGHHPNSYELQLTKSGQALYCRLCYSWGNLEGFRKAFGFRE